MTTSTIYKLEQISFSYDSLPVLTDINLEIKSQERVALIGPSGAGKTSLLKILAGLLAPTTGQIYLFDQDFTKASGPEKLALMKKIGLLFQKNALFDSMTSLNNIIFSLTESHQPHPEHYKTLAQNQLDLVGLSHAYQLFPAEMSGGMQKRLGIARAQSLKPEILLYDDPTAGLDPITSRKIIDLIIDLQSQTQSTIVVVTNEIQRAIQFATRILFLDQNQLVDLGSPEQAFENSDPRVYQFIRGLSDGPILGAQ